MGQSRGSGYSKIPTTTSAQQTLLDQLLAQALPNYQQAAQGFQQFLPGGTGGQAISSNAQRMFQQQTIPSILNSFGAGNKGSSSLNQALAAGASDLNSNIAAQLAQMQLGAAGGLGNLATGQANYGLTPQFAYMPKAQSPFQNAILGGLSGAGAGAQFGPYGAGLGGGLGFLGGMF